MKLAYFVVGTDDVDAVICFYVQFLAQSGMNRVSPNERMTYRLGSDSAFEVAISFDVAPDTNGSGTMVGLGVGSLEEVERLCALALEFGSTCEGELRHRCPCFSAYVREDGLIASNMLANAIILQ